MVDDATYKRRYKVSNWILKTEREFGDITNQDKDTERWSVLLSSIENLFSANALEIGLEEPIKRKSYEAEMVYDMLFRLEKNAKGRLL